MSVISVGTIHFCSSVEEEHKWVGYWDDHKTDLTLKVEPSYDSIRWFANWHGFCSSGSTPENALGDLLLQIKEKRSTESNLLESLKNEALTINERIKNISTSAEELNYVISKIGL